VRSISPDSSDETRITMPISASAAARFSADMGQVCTRYGLWAMGYWATRY
jgi:hypothetical protein